jgi:hypothetical protein
VADQIAAAVAAHVGEEELGAGVGAEVGVAEPVVALETAGGAGPIDPDAAVAVVAQQVVAAVGVGVADQELGAGVGAEVDVHPPVPAGEPHGVILVVVDLGAAGRGDAEQVVAEVAVEVADVELLATGRKAEVHVAEGVVAVEAAVGVGVVDPGAALAVVAEEVVLDVAVEAADVERRAGVGTEVGVDEGVAAAEAAAGIGVVDPGAALAIVAEQVVAAVTVEVAGVGLRAGVGAQRVAGAPERTAEGAGRLGRGDSLALADRAGLGRLVDDLVGLGQTADHE